MVEIAKAKDEKVAEEQVVIEDVPKQASLADCVAQLNKIRKAESVMRAEEAKAVAEVRRKLSGNTVAK